MAMYGDGPSGMNLPLVWNVAVTDLPLEPWNDVPNTKLGKDKNVKLGRLPAQLTPRIQYCTFGDAL